MIHSDYEYQFHWVIDFWDIFVNIFKEQLSNIYNKNYIDLKLSHDYYSIKIWNSIIQLHIIELQALKIMLEKMLKDFNYFTKKIELWS